MQQVAVHRTTPKLSHCITPLCFTHGRFFFFHLNLIFHLQLTGHLPARLPHLLSSLVLVTGGVDDGPGIRVKTKAIEHKPTGVTHSALCLLNRVLQFILCSFDQDAVMDWICGITATTNLRRGCY